MYISEPSTHLIKNTYSPLSLWDLVEREDVNPSRRLDSALLSTASVLYVFVLNVC